MFCIRFVDLRRTTRAVAVGLRRHCLGDMFRIGSLYKMETNKSTIYFYINVRPRILLLGKEIPQSRWGSKGCSRVSTSAVETSTSERWNSCAWHLSDLNAVPSDIWLGGGDKVMRHRNGETEKMWSVSNSRRLGPKSRKWFKCVQIYVRLPKSKGYFII